MSGLLTAGLAGALWLPGVAAAEVRTVPVEARQGDAVRLEFVVTEERPGVPTRQVEIRLPVDTPIAEVHPMSVPGWAPRISYRTLDRPVPGPHGGSVGTVTSAVTWTRATGSDGPARLALSMGPLPTADRISFEVLQTYSDGTVVRWGGPTGAGSSRPGPTLTLRPARSDGPTRPAGGHGTGNHGTGGQAPPAGVPAAGDEAPPAAGAGTGPEGGAVTGTGGTEAGAGTESTAGGGLLAAGLLAGLGFGVLGGWLGSRWRRLLPEIPAGPDRPEPADRPDPTG
ncbi:DUF1775 domain-containing protein [Micromonospora cathayae]|uniref:DUF1775 domain-containing protein n=1 Tax=Micromonospora cathayae TaxID=3028804 RepID=A0ABY7ZIB1_9ACTN|nr:DUF1775 domain-containing protein [Micromonospora sp. HUAS 3]WDZ82248.1 DUF1775 domain-containing protein [Micromonospora sp. HUAS 3]